MLRVAQGPERSRQLVLLMAVLLLPSVGVIGTMYATNIFEAGQCPPGALLWGTTGSGHLAQIIPMMVLPVWLIGWIATGRMARSGQSLLGMDARRARSALNWLVALLGGAWLFLLINGAYSQFCVTTQTVSYRDGVLAPTEVYPWSDVTRVVATCRHVSGRISRDDVGYWLVMRNGRDIDLGYSQVPLQRLLQVADAGLHNVPHSYDTSHVSSGCDPLRTRLLFAAGAAG